MIPFKPNWDEIPRQYNFATVDLKGRIELHRDEPFWNSFIERWEVEYQKSKEVGALLFDETKEVDLSDLKWSRNK